MSIPQQYLVSFCKSFHNFNLPSLMQGTIVLSQPTESIMGGLGATKKLNSPIGSNQLRELANQGQRI